MESRNRTLVTETVTVKPELRGVLPTSQILIPKSTYVKRFRVYQIKTIKKEYIYIYVVVNFLSQVIFIFPFVSTSLAYIIIPKNKRKTKIT